MLTFIEPLLCLYTLARAKIKSHCKLTLLATFTINNQRGQTFCSLAYEIIVGNSTTITKSKFAV